MGWRQVGRHCPELGCRRHCHESAGENSGTRDRGSRLSGSAIFARALVWRALVWQALVRYRYRHAVATASEHRSAVYSVTPRGYKNDSACTCSRSNNPLHTPTPVPRTRQSIKRASIASADPPTRGATQTNLAAAARFAATLRDRSRAVRAPRARAPLASARSCARLPASWPAIWPASQTWPWLEMTSAPWQVTPSSLLVKAPWRAKLSAAWQVTPLASWRRRPYSARRPSAWTAWSTVGLCSRHR